MVAASLPLHVDFLKLRAVLDDLRQHDSVLWRRAVSAGVAYGPDAFVRLSPPVFGLAFGAAMPKQRRAILRNLRLALGRRGVLAEAADVARVFVNFATCLTEAFVAGSGKDRLRAVPVDDEHYLGAIEEGHGVVLATAHTGGWQAAGPALRALHAADVLVVVKPERDARVQSLQDSINDRQGVRLHASHDALDALTLLSHLRRKGVVALQFDRVPAGTRGREVPFFDASWRVPEGPLKLASASGAPIVPVFTRRVGYMDYQVLVRPPIHVPKRPSAAELDGAARRVVAEMESFVRANPTQWFHFE
jgi:phosphatidylinositol dimannoside acyltransferase